MSTVARIILGVKGIVFEIVIQIVIDFIGRGSPLMNGNMNILYSIGKVTAAYIHQNKRILLQRSVCCVEMYNNNEISSD